METANQELSDELVKVRVEFKVSVGVRSGFDRRTRRRTTRTFSD